MASAPARVPKRRGIAAFVLAVVTGIFVGASVYGFRYAEGFSYMSDDPRACINCHVMRDHFDGWQKAAHHAVATCNDCHVPHAFIPKYLAKMEHGYRHSKGFTFQDFHEPIRITPADLKIVEDNCVRCHSGLVDPILYPGEVAHAEGLSCTHCHSAAGHGPRK